ncbi:MAG: hypothetical protein A4S09_14165 [Proteobacteria bacterium SG_bin7]|nr:MAG: hypothetical protein A4S09_14165 [Proteobacteria bacterium SG_bin7]
MIYYFRISIFSLFIVTQSTGCVSLSYGKKLTENTSMLNRGMTQQEARAILDNPDFVSSRNGKLFWHYNLLVKNEMWERTVGYTLVFDDGHLVEFGENVALTQDAAQRRGASAEAMSKALQENQRNTNEMYRQQNEIYKQQSQRVPSSSYNSPPECGPFSIPPLSIGNCKHVCVNGRWNQVCY